MRYCSFTLPTIRFFPVCSRAQAFSASNKHPPDIDLLARRVLRIRIPQHKRQILILIPQIIRHARIPAIVRLGLQRRRRRAIVIVGLDIHQAIRIERDGLRVRDDARVEQRQRDVAGRVDVQRQRLGVVEVGPLQQVGEVAGFAVRGGRAAAAAAAGGVESEGVGGDADGAGDAEGFDGGAGVAGGEGGAVEGLVVGDEDEVEGGGLLVVLGEGEGNAERNEEEGGKEIHLDRWR